MTNTIPGQLPTDAPPARALLAMIFGAVQTQLLSVAAQLKIPDLLKESPKSVKALAEATGTQEPVGANRLGHCCGNGTSAVHVHSTGRSVASRFPQFATRICHVLWAIVGI